MIKKKSQDWRHEVVTRVSPLNCTSDWLPLTTKPNILVWSRMKPSRLLLQLPSSSFPFTSCLLPWRWLPQKQFKSRAKILTSASIVKQIPARLPLPWLPLIRLLLFLFPPVKLHSCVKLTSVSLHATWPGIRVDTNLILLFILSSLLLLQDQMEEKRQWVNSFFIESGLHLTMEVLSRVLPVILSCQTKGFPKISPSKSYVSFNQWRKRKRAKNGNWRRKCLEEEMRVKRGK